MIGDIYRIVAGLLVLTLVVQAQEPRGTPGVDYPSYVSIPSTSFSCSEQQYIPGFYADLETQCQVFHFCLKNRKESFLCPTGTIFNQAILACDFWYRSNCSLAPLLYSTNSGPLLETARRSLPILIKLRHRAHIKSPVTSEANVYDKITSLYDGNTGAEQSDKVETSNAAEDVRPETDSEIEESKSHAELQALKEAEDSRFEGPSPNEAGEKVEPELYESLDENMKGNLLYDPVTERYYINYDSPQNDWQQDSDAEDDEFYDYETFGQNYDISARGYDLRSSDEVSYVSTENTVDDVVELQDLGNLETDHQFLKRGWNEMPSKRVRRKPIYTVIREDVDPEFESDSGTRYIFQNSGEDQPSTESTPVDSDSSTVNEASSERTVEITNEMRMPNYTPLNASEVPLTSEEFEHAILRELVEPKIDEHDFKVIGASHPYKPEQTEESTGDATSYQSDEAVDNEKSDDYESYPDEKDEIIIVDDTVSDAENDDNDIIIVDDQEPDADTDEEKGTDEIIIVDEPESDLDTDENAVDQDNEKMLADDTYVVIPDETDVEDFEANGKEKFLGDSSYNVESGERSESEVQNDEYDYEQLKGYCLSNYGCSEAYQSMDPSQAQNPEFYYPGQYEAQKQFLSEEYYNPVFRSPVEYLDHSSYAEAAAESGQEYPNYGFAQADSSREPFVDPGSYSYEQPTNYAGYMYGAQNEYPYGEYYGNAYVGENSQNLGFDASEYEVSSDSPVNEVPDAVAYNADYSQPFIHTDSNERLDTDSAVQPEIQDNMSEDETLSPKNGLNVESVSDEKGNLGIPSMNKDETYYVFDFEGVNGKMGVDPQSIEELAETNAPQTGQEESSQTHYSWQSVDSDGSPQSIYNVGGQSSAADISLSEDVEPKNLNVKSEGSESAADEKSKLSDTWSLQRSESDVVPNQAVGSSTLERLSDMNVNSPISSDTSNIYRSSDQFSGNKVYTPSRDFDASSKSQQFGGAGSFGNKEMNDFSSRSGTPTALKLSAIQERIRSLKQGKFGAFKKLVSSTGSKD